VDYSAPEGCPARDELVRHILERTSRARIAGETEEGRELQVRVVRAGGQFRGQLVVPSLNQERRVDDARCEEVVEALGFFVALIIDPTARTSGAPSAKAPATEEPPASAGAALAHDPPSPPAPSSSAALPAPSSASSPPTPPEQPPSSPETPPADRVSPGDVRTTRAAGDPAWRFGGGIGATAVTGIADGAVIGSRALLEVAKTPSEASLFAPSIAITGTSTSTSTIDSVRGSLALRWQALGASFCPFALTLAARLSVRSCTALEVGRVRADGIAMPNARRNDAPWVALGLAAQMEMAVWSTLGVRAELGASSPFSRSQFSYSSGEVLHVTPVLGLRAAVTLVVRPLLDPPMSFQRANRPVQ